MLRCCAYGEAWDHPAFILSGELWESWLDRKGIGNRFGIQRIQLTSLGAPEHD